jgi:hypothetical protein
MISWTPWDADPCNVAAGWLDFLQEIDASAGDTGIGIRHLPEWVRAR